MQPVDGALSPGQRRHVRDDRPDSDRYRPEQP